MYACYGYHATCTVTFGNTRHCYSHGKLTTLVTRLSVRDSVKHATFVDFLLTKVYVENERTLRKMQIRSLQRAATIFCAPVFVLYEDFTR